MKVAEYDWRELVAEDSVSGQQAAQRVAEVKRRQLVEGHGGHHLLRGRGGALVGAGWHSIRRGPPLVEVCLLQNALLRRPKHAL